MEASPFRADNFGIVVANLASNAWYKFAGAVFFWIYGVHLMTLYTVFGLILLDTTTGVWKAGRAGTLSSQGFFKFATKLLVYMILLANSSLVDKALGVSLAMSMTGAFLALTEAISVLENVTALGWNVPKPLVKTLRVYQAESIKVPKVKPRKRKSK